MTKLCVLTIALLLLLQLAFATDSPSPSLGPDLSPHLAPSPDSPPAMKKIQSPTVLRCIFLPLSCLLITVSFSNDSWSVWLSLLVQERKPSGNKILNEEYVAYKQQDCALASWLLASISSALASWLLASISPSILPGLVRCKSSFDIWQKLEQMYFISSTTRIMHLYCSLKSLRKRDHTMREYLDQIQAIYDNLAICGHPLSETVHISTILFDLPLEYESVVAIITSSQQPYKLDGVCSVLLDTEARQQDQLSQSIFSVNLAQGQIQSPGSILCQRQSFNSLGPSTQLVEGNTTIVQGQSSFSSPSVFQNQGVQQGSYHQGSNQNNNSYQQSRTSTPPYRGRGGAINHLTPDENNVNNFGPYHGQEIEGRSRNTRTEGSIGTSDSSRMEGGIGTSVSDSSRTEGGIGTSDSSRTEGSIGTSDSSRTEGSIGTSESSRTEGGIGPSESSRTEGGINTSDSSRTE
ncbi:hypothetical protein F3Y22_tig00110858pilonHSYRG00096 [Hibiscus syriacus]|uniref:Uncharacterized protein n=1 Tax=Hibiscus syriacus TaxID=106335 RepID=A0A6A2ZMM2_HIBSY|nr:hypothetical protein F3Y22_tig00110858pilonHSYRG00096 [Hibiscus syriacus]